ncbi:aminotransferase class I/II-fold pyridoxal phosphate-dependent enzyme [Bacillus sp. FJAT-49736]|uniref:trans-sulfuration enzyme family protein n=1 Tax=Bacillus sp. FJAT-49736 TaxID=2833582 RepID=UPI001BC9E14E|nr:aminotransferase class I/II-fold pyridoxal phosphate-dependent enzyme [Bacillus sp. FJAT-49736]MBS4172156.1 aminotransferase class I/II-fold pyridoxal phosphate-dependent enzyme [Bacillus sp. FJAT-49736]
MENFDHFDQEVCMHFNTDSDPFYGAIIPPEFGNSLFVFPTFEELVHAENDQLHHYVYWRGQNPTVEIVERKLAAFERGEICKCFASGMAAITAAVFNSVRAGDHVLCISNIYKSTLELLKYLDKFEVSHTVVYSTDKKSIEKAIQANTTLFFLENPTDMNLQLIDLQLISRIAKPRGIRTIIDNTWATPLFQKPITFGIDIVVHSLSKYLGGHSDLVGGAVITSIDIMNQLFNNEYLLFGGIMGPREASLLLKGLQTLPLRMKCHQENAKQVASFLASHPAVAKVNYPGLQAEESQLSKKHFSGFSGLLTFEIKNANYEAIKRVINRLRIFKIGVSWGSFESLVISPNYGNNVDELKRKHISPGLIRLSIGMEPASALIADLNQALS